MYELTLTPASIIRLVDDAEVNDTIPDIHYEFIPLRDVSKHTNESFVGMFELCELHCFTFFSMKMLLVLWILVRM